MPILHFQANYFERSAKKITEKRGAEEIKSTNLQIYKKRICGICRQILKNLKIFQKNLQKAVDMHKM